MVPPSTEDTVTAADVKANGAKEQIIDWNGNPLSGFLYKLKVDKTHYIAVENTGSDPLHVKFFFDLQGLAIEETPLVDHYHFDVPPGTVDKITLVPTSDHDGSY